MTTETSSRVELRAQGTNAAINALIDGITEYFDWKTAVSIPGGVAYSFDVAAEKTNPGPHRLAPANTGPLRVLLRGDRGLQDVLHGRIHDLFSCGHTTFDHSASELRFDVNPEK